MNMYERIELRCKELGIRPGTVCDRIGIRRAFMTEIKTGRTKNLSCEKVALIARELNVSCDWLITGEDFHPSITAFERSLISAWNQASDSERENVAFLLRNYGLAMPVAEETAASSA